MKHPKLILCVILCTIIAGKILSAQEQTVGLFLNDSTAYQGYTLFIPKLYTTTYLIDNEGRLVHSWEGDYNPAASAYLLETGNLLRASLLPDGGNNGGFREITWEGDITWEVPYGVQHHDLEPLPNGNVILITTDIIDAADALEMGRDPALLSTQLRALRIVEVAQVSADSTAIVWDWWARDHFIQDYSSAKQNFGIIADHPELIDLNFALNDDADWLHPNSIDYNPNLDQILVSILGFSEIWIIDHSTTAEEAVGHSGGNQGKGGDLLYRWGNPQAYGAGDSSHQILYRQHSTNWVASDCPGAGNITIFNNGLGRPDSTYSTIEEIVPPVDNSGTYFRAPDSAFGPIGPVWHYPEIPDANFYSAKFSSAQRLPNGNTLICSGVGGTFFEVTPAGQMVWLYVSPATANGPATQGDIVKKNDVYRIHRYGPDFPGFTGKDLTPGDPIELDPNSGVLPGSAVPDICRLSNNFPDPFNPVTMVNYSLSTPGFTTLTVYDLQGRKVAGLVNSYKTTGSYNQVWTGVDQTGRPVASGIYFMVLVTGGEQQSEKMLLLK